DSIQVAGGNIRREETIKHESDGRPRDRLRYPDPWGNARWGQHIYYQLLEAGLRVPPTAGSGSGEAPNPIGYNRVYVRLDGEFSGEKWWEGLRAGRVFVTNGPLLKPSVNGQLPGHVFRGDEGSTIELEIGLTFSTRDPISYLEIVKNGQVEHSIPFAQYAKGGRLPDLKFDASGWFLVRAVTDLPNTYRFAMTGPYYVEIGGKPRISRAAVQFFIDWVYQRAAAIEIADPQQKREVLDWHRRARDFWRELLSRANAD
ncbi:MAG: CehA/McbA family metallohydrolase, partial [Pirellulaceae bacterium]|nr:CehA/McbA family metallohydrolase [Pirellulaceae bacterium]